MCLIFYDYFPFFLFCYWQILSSREQKKHLMNYNTTICWQCELAPFFSLIVELRWNYCIFCSFILFRCFNIYPMFVFRVRSCEIYFLIWMIAHTKIMKIVAFSSKSWKLINIVADEFQDFFLLDCRKNLESPPWIMCHNH